MDERMVQSRPPPEVLSPLPVQSKIEDGLVSPLPVQSKIEAEVVSPLPAQRKIEAQVVSPVPVRMKIESVAALRSLPFNIDPTDEEKMEALSLAVRSGTKAEVAVYLAARSSLQVQDLEKVYFFAFQNGPKVEELKKLFSRAVDGVLGGDEILPLAHQSGVTAEEVAKILFLTIRVGLYSDVEKFFFFAVRAGMWSKVEMMLSLAAQSEGNMNNVVNFTIASLAVQAAIWDEDVEVEQVLSLAAKHVNNNTDLACHVLVQSGILADVVLEAAIKTGLKAREDVYAAILKQLLASFSKRQKDPQLDEWERPPKPKYSVTQKRSDPREDPKCPFFLFKMKASAKTAHISWWMKKYPCFPPERAGYTDALRVARLGTGTDGFHLEQAGGGRQPGALSYYIDVTYTGWPRPKEGILNEGSSAPLREVAVIKRLPGGDGISVMSYVYGLGVKLRDILFLLHCPSATVALSFNERSFYVSKEFKGMPLYAPAGLDFIDIYVPVKNLIKKLYLLYQQEEQLKIMKHEKQDLQGSQKLVCQREKPEDLRRREESKNYRDLRKGMKEARIKDTSRTSKEEQHEEYGPMLLPTFLLSEECDLVKPSEELYQSEKRHDELLTEVVKHYDLLNLGGGGSEANGTREPSTA